MEKTLTDRYFEKLDIDHDDSLSLTISERASGSLIIYLHEDVSRFDLHFEAGDYSYSKVLIQNLSKKKLDLTINGGLFRDAVLRMGFLDLEKDEVTAKTDIHLNETGADFEIYTGQLCGRDTKKVNAMEVIHEADHTYGNMHNFAVQFDDSYYEMVANGNIKNDCPGSQSHQETRVLTLGKGHTSKVIPLLLIDENSVKASHALTIGQPDVNQMYYLQSRGLSRARAMGLLSIGYFMPVIDLIDDEDEKKHLREEMESKVGLYGYSETYR